MSGRDVFQVRNFSFLSRYNFIYRKLFFAKAEKKAHDGERTKSYDGM